MWIEQCHRHLSTHAVIVYSKLIRHLDIPEYDTTYFYKSKSLSLHIITRKGKFVNLFRSLLRAQFLKFCMLISETQRRALCQSQVMKILNNTFPRMGIETTTVKFSYVTSHIHTLYH